MKTAVVHMPTVFADVKANLAQAETYIQSAAQNHADIIIFPEFFTTGFALNPALLPAIVESSNIPERLKQLSRTYQIAIGGSYLHYIATENQAYNTFGLFFPTGETYYHNKDIPTGLENFCYTTGDQNSAFTTPLGRIGVVMCWEQLRYDSARRMAGKIDLLVGGSCWWGFTPEDGERTYRALSKKNQSLAYEAPIHMAKLLGVPFVHASHSTGFYGGSLKDSKQICLRPTESRTMVIDAQGSNLFLDDGTPGCYFAEITPGCIQPEIHLPRKKYWILPMPYLLKKGYEMLNAGYSKYYENNTRKQLASLL